MAYDVKAGDTITKIALAHGFYKWETIWKDASNKSLREKRNNPHVLHPGDSVVIPEIKRNEVACSTEKHHVFQVPALKEVLRLRVEQSRGEPMSKKPYKLTLDGKEYSGDTNENGLIEVEIPVNSEKGELKVEGCLWPLEIGHLNPVDESTSDGKISGAQARLNNLGYDCGEITGTMNDQTREAIRAFQADQSFDEDKQTGDLDDDTCARLKTAHGC